MDNKFPYEVTFGLSEHLWWCSYKQLLHYQDYFYFTQDTHDLSGLQISIQYSFIIAAIKVIFVISGLKTHCYHT